jgi:hypothetical protein
MKIVLIIAAVAVLLAVLSCWHEHNVDDWGRMP